MDFIETSFSNGYASADEEIVDKVKSFLLDSTNEWSMMEITRKTKLTKTKVSLSLNTLLKAKLIICNINTKDKKKYYTSIKNQSGED